MRRVFAAFVFSVGLQGALPAVAATDQALPAGVTARATEAGTYFADANGMALYTYLRDIVPGKSACVAECAKTWPPVAAATDAKSTGDWSIITRDDGTAQWAFKGQPLYTYIKDSYPGGALGDGVGNAWRVAFEPIYVPPGLNIRAIFAGRVLTDARGMTVYTRTGEEKSQAACDVKCAETWVPLAAPLLANPISDWTALPRTDGTLQWAYKGQRLYLNTKDIKPSDLKGDGVDKVWRAVVLDPAPPLPDWVTTQRADMGEIYADAKGMTLYTFSGVLERTKKTMCDDDCIKKAWSLIPAAPDAKPTGDWTIIAAEDGAKVWAYKGNQLYTHNRDKEPGAVGGDKWAAGVGGAGGGWGPIQRRRDFEE